MHTKNFNKRELLKYVGDLSQVFGIKEYTLSGGKSQGVKAFDFRNGAGLEFTVLADRCLDIAGLTFKGTNCSYLSKTGIVAPEFYNEDGAGFLRSFNGGFLTTCGLRNVGSPCEDEGESFGVHGRISNTPAEEVCARVEWSEGLPVLTITGRMREARLFGENLVLERKITCRYGENKISIQNTIENYGFRKEPLMLLFHFNMGYPLLDENARFVAPTQKLIPRDTEAQKGVESSTRFHAPTPGYAEQVFYHELKSGSEGNTSVALVNDALEVGVAIHFSRKQLSRFTQWKQMGEGEYVLGMEPCNCEVGGRADARQNDTLEYLEPGEIKRFDLDIEIVDGMNNIDTLTKEINNISNL
jgi:hypothetical protein